MNILRGYEIVVVKLYFCILILEKYKIYVILKLTRGSLKVSAARPRHTAAVPFSQGTIVRAYR